ncbi:MAG TPA: undecaprenyldiphospho-muramoylpentapeptide beta-N-acetylglucosaminyltransferase [Pseudomonadales bacterium]|nr:undecaprenyldiphospho-muramoylpentapeptide beta-N-acetylglucosaminyltransferase [Pseudomonadales bacterium]
MKKLERVYIMAGGTGGHVFPALATAKVLIEQGVQVKWLGTPQGIESEIVPRNNLPLFTVAVAGVRGQGIKRLLTAPLRVGAAIFTIWKEFRAFKPQVVLGLGGFVTGPGGVAAKLAGVPLIIHEQNAIPGFTNKMLARISKAVYQAFPTAFPENARTFTIGNPIRQEICQLPSPDQRFAQRNGAIKILVLGGSQGAKAINELMPEALARIDLNDRPQVIHQAGKNLIQATQEKYSALKVAATVTPFLHDMAAAYADADLVVCRSGALTVSELAAAGVGAVLIPFPFAVDDHQTKNAEFLANHGAAVLIQQRDLSAEKLADLLIKLCQSREPLLKMANAARELAQPQATAKLVQACVEAAQ